MMIPSAYIPFLVIGGLAAVFLWHKTFGKKNIYSTFLVMVIVMAAIFLGSGLLSSNIIHKFNELTNPKSIFPMPTRILFFFMSFWPILGLAYMGWFLFKKTMAAKKQNHLLENADGSIYGEVKHISHSNIRINKQRLYIAKVAYLGIEKDFEDLPPDFGLNVMPGALVRVRYNISNPYEAVLDLSEPIQQGGGGSPAGATAPHVTETTRAPSMKEQVAASGILEAMGDNVPGHVRINFIEATNKAEGGKVLYALKYTLFPQGETENLNYDRELPLDGNVAAQIKTGFMYPCLISNSVKGRFAADFSAVGVA